MYNACVIKSLSVLEKTLLFQVTVRIIFCRKYRSDLSISDDITCFHLAVWIVLVAHWPYRWGKVPGDIFKKGEYFLQREKIFVTIRNCVLDCSMDG